MKQVPVIILGIGGVGQALIQQIINGRSAFAARNQCAFQVVALTDSQSVLWAEQGLSDEQLQNAIATKKAKRPLSDDRPALIELLDRAKQAGHEQAIVVDVTAVGGLEPVMNHALELGWSLALANKKAFAGPWATAQTYFNNPRVRHESTVGGGQPVIATMRYLMDVKDEVLEIEGQLSGTLGFINGRLDHGDTFSQALSVAKERGYTEPDPREDLSGQDVMRKILILGRMAGWAMEASDITVESLYPAEMANLSVTQFMSLSPRLDAAIQARVDAAKAEGNVLRYVAQLAQGKGSVGLKPIPAQSPLANLKYISFRTQIYNDERLLIGGKGAGVEMTAAGVLGDMLDLVRETIR